jgi:hypothetical protein
MMLNLILIQNQSKFEHYNGREYNAGNFKLW